MFFVLLLRKSMTWTLKFRIPGELTGNDPDASQSDALACHFGFQSLFRSVFCVNCQTTHNDDKCQIQCHGRASEQLSGIHARRQRVGQSVDSRSNKLSALRL